MSKDPSLGINKAAGVLGRIRTAKKTAAALKNLEKANLEKRARKKTRPAKKKSSAK